MYERKEKRKEKMGKKQVFCKKICICQKKAVLLWSETIEVLSIRVITMEIRTENDGLLRDCAMMVMLAGEPEWHRSRK